jgi:hypothetical protein
MNLLTLSILSAAALVMAGCSQADVTPKEGCWVESVNAPEWVCGGGEIPGYYSAVGSAPSTKGGFDFDRKSANHSARAAIAAQINSEMEASFTMKKRAERMGSKQNYQAEVTQDAISTSQVKLPPSTQRELWQHPDGTIFVLVTIKKKGN